SAPGGTTTTTPPRPSTTVTTRATTTTTGPRPTTTVTTALKSPAAATTVPAVADKAPSATTSTTVGFRVAGLALSGADLDALVMAGLLGIIVGGVMFLAARRRALEGRDGT
ncbi:MAG TPA: hypothetical protein VHH09_05035, partial [Acidimicrobiales bacterium]|nr:hypothetical protein [Acidimicrobiales bacterium]